MGRSGALMNSGPVPAPAPELEVFGALLRTIVA